MNYADFVAGQTTPDPMEASAEITSAAFASVLKLGIVMEVLNDPGALSAERLNVLDDGCMNAAFIPSAPRNSILVRLIVGGEGKKTLQTFFCYPLFPPHMCMPIKPGETVWLIDPMPTQESDVLYWMCRAITPDYVDDVNFTHADRSIMESAQKSRAETPPTLPGFPNGDSKDSSKFTLSPPEVYETIYTGSYGNEFINFERVPRFTKRPADLAFQGSNNTLICLGEDRGYTIDFRPKEDRTFPADGAERNVSNANKKTDGSSPAGNWKKDETSDLGDPTEPPEPFKVRKDDFKAKEPEFRGTIDIVAGRGQSDAGTKPLEIENTWKWKETNKNPVNFGDVADADKDPVNNWFMNPAEGDPDFLTDLSRVYVSMKTSGDKNFGLTYANADATPVDDVPYVIVKSDEARIVVREAGSIRFVKEGENQCEISMLSNGKIAMDANKIYLGEHSAAPETEPAILGATLVTALDAFATKLKGSPASSTGNLGAPVLMPDLVAACTALIAALPATKSGVVFVKD